MASGSVEMARNISSPTDNAKTGGKWEVFFSNDTGRIAVSCLSFGWSGATFCMVCKCFMEPITILYRNPIWFEFFLIKILVNWTNSFTYR